MMRKMRENTKWIMLITAIAFVGLMVFEWGMDMSGRSAGNVSGGEVGRVNGEPIGGDEYNFAYRSLYQQQQQMIDGPITGVMNRQIEEAAWDQLVMQRLINQELRRRGLSVTDAEIRQAARFAPPPEFLQSEMFLTDGEFDLQKYHQFLASPMVDNELLMQLEGYYREVIPRSKLYYQATAGVFVSDAELWRMYRDANETATVRFVSVDPARVVSDAELTVTDDEIRAYYRDNREHLRRDARASVRFVFIARTPQAADTLATRQRADQLRAEILAGEDFGDVARRESADAVSAREGGRLSILRGQTVEPFDRAAFSLPIGQISEPVQTQFGFHLIRVENRTDDEAEVRHILVPITLSEENENRLFERADSLERLGERLTLEEAAQQLGLTVRVGELTPGLAFLPQLLGPADEGSAWAFEEAEIGEVSPLFETDEAYYMLELVSRQEAGAIPLREATPQIRTLLLERKRVERTRTRVREQLRAGQLERVAAAFNEEVLSAGPFRRGDFVPGLGRMNAAIGAAFGLQPGQFSDAIEADGMVHVVQLVEREQADRAEWEAQREVQRRNVTPAIAEQRWNQFLTALRENATIVDNRALLRRGVAQPPPLAGF
jgi:peptidyl-prolyl cis-trans isomerase D